MTGIRVIRPGWHFGTAATRGRVGRFCLTETSFPPDLRTPWHGHEAPAFCLVQRGRTLQRFRRREVDYVASSVLFRPSRVEHTDRVSSAGASFFIIEPDATWLADVGLGRLRSDSALVHTGPRARWLVEQALAESRQVDATTPIALEGLMLALGAEFARIFDARPGRRIPPWLVRTREALDDVFPGRLTLSALAADAGVHAVYLASAFRSAFGTFVGSYVRARRIDAARQALHDRSRPINEIALTLGYSSQSHFTRVFRQQTGFTPLAYRRVHARD